MLSVLVLSSLVSASAFAIHPHAKELDGLKCYVTMVQKGGVQTELAFTVSPKGQLVAKLTTTIDADVKSEDLVVNGFTRAVSDHVRYDEAKEDYKITRAGEPINYDLNLARQTDKGSLFSLTYQTGTAKYVNATLQERKQDVKPIGLWCSKK